MKSVFSHLRAWHRDRLHDPRRQLSNLNASRRAFGEKDLECFWGGVHFEQLLSPVMFLYLSTTGSGTGFRLGELFVLFGVT